MKIERVTYSRLVSVERFGNVKVEATALLEDGDEPDDAFTDLRQWVDLQVLTKKHKIERATTSDDDDEPYNYSSTPPRAQQFQQNSPTIVGVGANGQALTVNGSGQMVPAGSISAQQTSDPRAVPAGGRFEMLLRPNGSALRRVYDADGDLTHEGPITDDQARTLVERGGEALNDILRDDYPGQEWEEADRARAGLSPADGWLQVQFGPVGGYDTIQFMNWPITRTDRAVPAGTVQSAIDAGLLVARRHKPGLTFGPSGELVFNQYIDGVAAQNTDSAEVDCPACNGQGHNKHTFDDCSLCEGDGVLPEPDALAWLAEQ